MSYQPPSAPLPPYGSPQQPQYQQQPPMQPMPAPKPRRRPPWLWIIASLFVGFLIGFAVHAPPETAATTSTQQQTATTVSNQPTPAATKVPATPTHQPKWTTVQTFSGNGSQKTKIFAVSDDWRIAWKCTGFTDGSGIDGNLNITINDSQNVPVDNLLETCKIAGSSGVSEEHQGGNVYLAIDHAGSGWSVQVQVLQ